MMYYIYKEETTIGDHGKLAEVIKSEELPQSYTRLEMHSVIV